MVLELPADYCLKERVAGFIFNTLKGTRNSYFCLTPKNHPLMFVSWKYLKALQQKK